MNCRYVKVAGFAFVTVEIRQLRLQPSEAKVGSPVWTLGIQPHLRKLLDHSHRDTTTPGRIGNPSPTGSDEPHTDMDRLGQQFRLARAEIRDAGRNVPWLVDCESISSCRPRRAKNTHGNQQNGQCHEHTPTVQPIHRPHCTSLYSRAAAMGGRAVISHSLAQGA